MDQNRPILSDRARKEDFPVKFQIRRSQYEEFAIYLFTKVTTGLRLVLKLMLVFDWLGVPVSKNFETPAKRRL